MSEPDKYNLVKNPQHEELANAIPIKQSQLEARAKQYFNEAKPLDGTLAQSYLNKQGINVGDHDNLRYHPAVFSSETRKTYPALIANITNDKSETKAVEITYLDKNNTDIAGLKINKRILGSKSGNSIDINKGSNTNYSIVAVGIENALKLNNDNKAGADIIALNNNNDVKTFKTDGLRENVIIVLDSNNQQDTTKLANDLEDKFSKENKNVSIIEPNKFPEGLDTFKTTKQFVNEAIHNFMTKDNAISKTVQALSNDITNTNNIMIKDDTSAFVSNRIKHDEHFQHVAIDSQRTSSPAKDIEQPRFDIGEKSM